MRQGGQGRTGPVPAAQEGGLLEGAPGPAGSGIQAAERPSPGYLTAAAGRTPHPRRARRRLPLQPPGGPGPAALPQGGASGPSAGWALAWSCGHGRERPGLPAQRPPHTALAMLPSPYRPRCADLSTARSPHRPLYAGPLYCPSFRDITVPSPSRCSRYSALHIPLFPHGRQHSPIPAARLGLRPGSPCPLRLSLPAGAPLAPIPAAEPSPRPAPQTGQGAWGPESLQVLGSGAASPSHAPVVLPPSLRIWCRTCCRGLLTALPRVTVPCDLRDRRQEDSALRSGRPGEVAARRGLAAGQGGSLPPAGVDDSGGTAPHMAGRPGAAGGGRGKKALPRQPGTCRIQSPMLGPSSAETGARQGEGWGPLHVVRSAPVAHDPRKWVLAARCRATVAACGRATWARCGGAGKQ